MPLICVWYVLLWGSIKDNEPSAHLFPISIISKIRKTHSQRVIASSTSYSTLRVSTLASASSSSQHQSMASRELRLKTEPMYSRTCLTSCWYWRWAVFARGLSSRLWLCNLNWAVYIPVGHLEVMRPLSMTLNGPSIRVFGCHGRQIQTLLS